MTATDQSAIEAALQPFAEMLAADGYELHSRLEGEVVELKIVAGASACEECLVPRTVMEPIMSNALGEAGLSVEIDLRYPVGGEH